MTQIRVVVCPHCHVRRRCHVYSQWETSKDGYRHWTCSQGHTWKHAIATAEKIVALLKLTFLPMIMERAQATSTLYDVIKSR